MAFCFLIAFGLSLILSHLASASLAPSYPEPGTVWTVGKDYEIKWEEDGTKPSMAVGWKNFKIDLMTGDNMDQIFLTNVASNLSADGAQSFRWKVPDVAPYSPIYFFMFTNDKGENAWTTRFAIVGEDGNQEFPDNHIQPSGEKIPWGIGKLVMKAAADRTSSGPAPSSTPSATAEQSSSSSVPESSSSTASVAASRDNGMKVATKDKSGCAASRASVVLATALGLFATFLW
ncbi:hypothetical protein BJV82DRAFT_674332 [Fennellomyces sp. T-0311]|nr:hypothetical protein BJV82DRAFT_674332 [Fennellomyces sp. T-0311]